MEVEPEQQRVLGEVKRLLVVVGRHKANHQCIPRWSGYPRSIFYERTAEEDGLIVITADAGSRDMDQMWCYSNLQWFLPDHTSGLSSEGRAFDPSLISE